MENTKRAFYPFDVLLPKKEYDLEKWAVIACDQYTSDIPYWDALAGFVGDAPSTLKIIVPEAYLNGQDVDARISSADRTMESYVSGGVFEEYKSSMVYVEREQTNGTFRCGLVGTIDLDDYDFKNSGGCLVRPTEDVVVSRIPPRLKVRENALLETSHVLLLIADRDDKVLGSLRDKKSTLNKLYDFRLRPDGGEIRGYQVEGGDVAAVQDALEALTKDGLLFLVGDGNHSVATAKEYHEAHKDNKLAAYTTVEVINLFDDSLIFEPIHRIVYNADAAELKSALMAYYPGTAEGRAEGHNIEFCSAEGSVTLTVPYKYNPLAVGALQQFLDSYCEGHACELDYIHSPGDVRRLAGEPGNVGFVLPDIDADEMFSYVKEKGRLPRKTFSIGNQEDKKYYLECRKIR